FGESYHTNLAVLGSQYSAFNEMLHCVQHDMVIHCHAERSEASHWIFADTRYAMLLSHDG
ncbi:MAG TPA: hypothetical protein VFT66_12570, partial [Roseiflexaceae bacterium]|nr:hypothetical protein [Roseiflexaceae bacterium]